MVNTNSYVADWQRCVRDRRYPPGVMPGTPEGRKFLGSIDIARAAHEAVKEAPRMPREEPTPSPPARKRIEWSRTSCRPRDVSPDTWASPSRRPS